MPEKRFTIYDLRFTIYRNWILFFLLSFFLGTIRLQAQVQQLGAEENAIDYASPKEYTIGGITVTGVKYLDENVLKTLSGLSVGDS